MQQFLTNAGFNMKNTTFVPLSGLTGANVVKKPAKGAIPWYKGQTLLEILGTLISSLNLHSTPLILAPQKPPIPETEQSRSRCV